jgi:hypothetical protein
VLPSPLCRSGPRRFGGIPHRFRAIHKGSQNLFAAVSESYIESARGRGLTPAISLLVTYNPPENFEKLIRVRAERRGQPIELRVHYAAASEKGCTVYSILSASEVE